MFLRNKVSNYVQAQYVYLDPTLAIHFVLCRDKNHELGKDEGIRNILGTISAQPPPSEVDKRWIY